MCGPPGIAVPARAHQGSAHYRARHRELLGHMGLSVRLRTLEGGSHALPSCGPVHSTDLYLAPASCQALKQTLEYKDDLEVVPALKETLCLREEMEM